jgi:protein involved in polysaccharide export with SLBB domain
MFTKNLTCTLLLLAFLLAVNAFTLSSQQPPQGQFDFRTVKVDELQDSQIRQLVNRARSEGMSLRELETQALSRGMPHNEVIRLRERIAILEVQEESQDRPELPGRRVTTEIPVPSRLFDELFEPIDEIRVFGFDLFRRESLSFEPSLNIPTPANYQLGPGDEIIIEVWGASQQSYRPIVTPEGHISISNIGPVMVSGMTVEKASDLIKSRLSGIYSGMRTANPNTWAQVSLGNVRSIKVTVSGDAYMPGTYTLPAFATAFNALYYAGGPSESGSFREIRVIRQGQRIATIDLYDFLLKGETKLNIRLQDEDLIFLGPTRHQVTISGEVKRPAIYELRENETLADLVAYCGGFSSMAYSRRLQVDRKTDSQRRLLSVESDLFSSFLMQNGDMIEVGEILERYENRVTVQGAVFREGQYGLTDGMTLKELISKAEGLREDAFTSRVAIYRLLDNLETEVLEYNLQQLIENNNLDVPLRREDMVVISSVLDLQEERTVRIMGEVRQPDIFPFARNISLGELIRMAGGLTDAASLSRVEVARRVNNKTADRPGDQVSRVYSFPLDGLLSLGDEASSFILEPFDMVFVRRSPGYREQVIAQVQGEVNFPGSYAITRKTERISDLINRAGGFTDDAYVPGATLIRRVEHSQRERLERLTTLDTTEFDLETLIEARDQSIGINLERILRNPRGVDDLILEEGDILRIPQELQTVRLNGALLYPVTARYQGRMGVRGYVSQAGGFANNASKRNVFVVYANGSVDRTRNYGLFRSYPSVEPGAEIIVPQKPERPQRTIQETLAISSAMTSLALVIVTILNQF